MYFHSYLHFLYLHIFSTFYVGFYQFHLNIKKIPYNMKVVKANNVAVISQHAYAYLLSQTYS